MAMAKVFQRLEELEITPDVGEETVITEHSLVGELQAIVKQSKSGLEEII